MIIEKKIIYGNNEYFYCYYNYDDSGTGSVIEMIDNSEYKLDRFVNLSNKIILDIGANHGLATIILAKQNPKSQIFSFEPNPKIFEVLKLNVKNNNLNNVKLFNKALHTENNLKLMEHPKCSGASILSNDKTQMDLFYKKKGMYGISDVNEINVDSISIDEFLLNENILNIYLMKIDCEGSEYDILLNSKKLFSKVSIENIVGEFHNLSYNKNEIYAEELVDFCRKKINGVVDIKILNLL